MARTKAGPSKNPAHTPAGKTASPAPSRGKSGPSKTATHTPSGKTAPRAPARSGQAKKPAAPGVAALKEIRLQQKQTTLLIPMARFDRVVREIAQDMKPDVRFTPNALRALQTAAEDYIVKLFEQSQSAAIHGKRITLLPKDVHHVRQVTNKLPQL